MASFRSTLKMAGQMEQFTLKEVGISYFHKLHNHVLHFDLPFLFFAGTVYLLHEPLFFQSIRNQFIFRCADGIHIDGNDRGISKFIFK